MSMVCAIYKHRNVLHKVYLQSITHMHAKSNMLQLHRLCRIIYSIQGSADQQIMILYAHWPNFLQPQLSQERVKH